MQRYTGATPKHDDEQSLAADLHSDWALTAQLEKNWLVIFSASKTKLIPMNWCSLKESFCLGCFLEFKLNPQILNILPVAKDIRKVFGSYYRYSKYLTSAILYRYKRQLRAKMKYCHRICVAAVQSLLSTLTRVQTCRGVLGGDELFTNLATIFSQMSHRKPLAYQMNYNP